MPLLLPHIDIKSLIERYAPIKLAGVSRANGIEEYHSNCPWCPGSTDSFIMCPDTGRYSHAIRSKGCGRHGDMQDFLREYAGLSYQEICEALEIDPTEMGHSSPVAALAPLSERPPGKIWQEAATAFLARAERYLWHPRSTKGQEALAYLRARGFTDETIRRARLGYCPAKKDGSWYECPLADWGIDPASVSEEKRAQGTVRIPPGIVIPWFEGPTVWKLAIKRYDQPKPYDYGQVLGSGEGLYGVDTIQYGEPAMLVEGELDALSVQQAAGDLVHCVATGSTTRGRLMRWIGDLSFAGVVLQSFDNDQAGEEGAPWWIKALASCMRWAPEGGKDPNDLLRAHGSAYLRAWVQVGLDAWQISQQPEEPDVPQLLPDVSPAGQLTPSTSVVEAVQRPAPAGVELAPAASIDILARLIAEAVRVFDPSEIHIEQRVPGTRTLARRTPAHRKTFLDYR